MNFFKGLDSDLREGLKDALTLSWSHSLCLLDGYSLTQEQAHEVLLGSTSGLNLPSADVLKLISLKHAVQRTFELAEMKGFTLSDLCELHRLCGHEVSSKWKWRDINSDPLYLTAQNRLRDWSIKANRTNCISREPNDVLSMVAVMQSAFLRTYAFERSMMALASLASNIVTMRYGIMPTFPAPRTTNLYLETVVNLHKACYDLGPSRLATEKAINDTFVTALSSGLGSSYYLLKKAHDIQAKRAETSSPEAKGPSPADRRSAKPGMP